MFPLLGEIYDLALKLPIGISYIWVLAHFFVHGMTSATYIIEIWQYWFHSKHQNWHWRCRSSRIWIYVWLSSGDQYLLLAAPVLAFLAFILKICLISKIVRLETLQFTHKNQDLKIVTKKCFENQPDPNLAMKFRANFGDIFGCIF